MRVLVTTAVLILTAAVLFAAWMHPAVLDPRNIGWLLDGHDRGQSAIGLAAYLAGGAWPLLHNPLLLAPEGTSLLLTDSIPLLGLLLGPFADSLAGMQFVGLWLFACVVLQLLFAWALVRPHAPDALGAWLGAVLLAAMPMLFNRYGHASLCAQWLILWALWIYVAPHRDGRPLWWLAVLGTAALVHSYLLLMVASIWAGSLLRRVGRRDGTTAISAILAEAVLLTGLVALMLAALGVFGGGFQSTGTYGRFPMALDAWWNPANPSYSALLPSSPEDHARGYEGLQYLGAGLLALVAVAGIAALAGRRTGAGGLGWLLPGFMVVGLIAIGPAPLIWGKPVVTMALPPWLVDALDPVRAGGRLFWPATYTLAYAAITRVLALPRGTMIVAAALAVQVIDLTPMLAAIRATSARANDPASFTRTRDPRWPALIARARHVDFTPADHLIDAAVLQEVTWRAVLARRPVGFTYTARIPQLVRTRLAAERAAFVRGQVPAGRLLIVQDGEVPPALRRRALRIDGVTLIAP